MPPPPLPGLHSLILLYQLKCLREAVKSGDAEMAERQRQSQREENVADYCPEMI